MDDEELDYGEEEARHDGQHSQGAEGEDAGYRDLDEHDYGQQAAGEDRHEGAGGGQAALQHPNGEGGAGGAAGGGSPSPRSSLPAASFTAPAPGERVAEEWEVMEVPEEWRPRPMVRLWGLPAAATEEEVAVLLDTQGLELGVASVAFDPKQTTAAGRVALVRFEPPPLPLLDAPPPLPEADVGKLAEGMIAALRAKQLELHDVKINVEKTGAEVCLFLANLRGEAASDEGLRAACQAHGAVERCFVMRNPAGDSKHYGFCEFTLPSAAVACKEAWNREGEAQRPQAQRDPASTDKPRFVRVKLQRAEAAPVRSVAGLFATVLYVDNIQPSFTSHEALKRVFSEFGEVTSCYLPRNPSNPAACRGFAFVQFKHSFTADAALRALDETEHEGIGKLLISFSNPVKANDHQHRPTGAGAGGQRQQQQRLGGGRGSAQGLPGGRAAGGGRAGGAPVPAPPAPIVWQPSVPGQGGMLGGPLVKPPPPAGPPPPPPRIAQQQLEQQQAAQAQLAMQQRLAMQQMLMMQQQQPWLAMQQAMLQQQQAAAEQLRAKAAAEAERQRKEEEERKKAEDKARLEAEYAARLGYGVMPGMQMPAGLDMSAFAGNPFAAMASMPGFAAAFGMPGAMSGAMPGLAGFGVGAAAGAGAAPEPAEPARGGRDAGAGYAAGGYGDGGYADADAGGGDNYAYDPYQAAGTYGGGRSGGGAGAYGGSRDAGAGYGGRRDDYAPDYAPDYNDSINGRGYADDYGGGGGYGQSRGGQGKRGSDSKGGGSGGYGDSYSYAPKRPRY